MKTAGLDVRLVQEDDAAAVRDAAVAIVLRIDRRVELVVAADRGEEQAAFAEIVLGDGMHGEARALGGRRERALSRAVR